MNEDFTGKAREYFAGDLFATQCAGIVIDEAVPGYARCSMKITPQHCNALGNPMGGAVFTLADFAFAVAANIGGQTTVSQASQITFLEPGRGGELFAESKEIRRGRSSCFYQTEVTDASGRRVAFITTNGFIVS